MRHLFKVISSAVAVAFASPAYSMPLGLHQQTDDLVVKVRWGCGPGFQPVNGVCVSNISARHVRRYDRRWGYAGAYSYASAYPYSYASSYPYSYASTSYPSYSYSYWPFWGGTPYYMLSNTYGSGYGAYASAYPYAGAYSYRRAYRRYAGAYSYASAYPYAGAYSYAREGSYGNVWRTCQDSVKELAPYEPENYYRHRVCAAYFGSSY